MIAGAHWGFWLGLVVALVAGAAELVRRANVRERQLFAALLEQGRREETHDGPAYRFDQSVRATQQRLSRSWGKRAYSPATRARIEKALRQ